MPSTPRKEMWVGSRSISGIVVSELSGETGMEKIFFYRFSWILDWDDDG